MPRRFEIEFATVQLHGAPSLSVGIDRNQNGVLKIPCTLGQPKSVGRACHQFRVMRLACSATGRSCADRVTPLATARATTAG